MEKVSVPSSDCCAPGATGKNEKSGGTNCPNCGIEGQKVKNITVRSMVFVTLIESVDDHDFLFCRTSDCPVVYYNNTNGKRFDKDDVKVRVWLKETEDPIPICYCSAVTKKQILEAILENGCPPTLEAVQERTGAGRGGKCLTRNPYGRCCHPAVKAVIQKAEKMLAVGIARSE